MSTMEISTGSPVNVTGVVAPSPAAPVAKVEVKDIAAPNSAQVAQDQTRAKETEGLKQMIAKQANIKDASNLNLEFGIDKATERVYAQVTNKVTGEVVKQIPSKEFLEMMARVRHAVDGFFVDTRG